MLIVCSSCNSKYLINSADLKPKGRNVQCAKCENQWFQTTDLSDLDKVDEVFDTSFSKKSIKDEKKINQENLKKTNLPSTYVREQKASYFNSILVLFFIFFLCFLYWSYKEHGMNFLVLINFYIEEFYFNLKLIINDFAKIVYQIIN